jgi:outer membrane protein TolC
MNRIRKGILGLLLTGIVAGSYAQTAAGIHHFSVKECIDYAHLHSAQVKNALLDLQIQQQTNKGITAGALPTISATGSSTDYFNIPVQPVSDFITPAVYGVLVNEGVKNGSGNPITLPTGNPAVFPFSLYQKYGASGSVQLTQTLFDGTVFIGLQARKASIDYYQKAIDLTEESIKVNIYKVYYQLVVSKTQMELIDANITRAEKLLNDASVMYKNGFLEKLDVDKATVQLANLQTQKLTTQSGIDNGYLGLKYLMGMPIKDSLTLTATFSEENLKSGILNDSAYSYDNRFDYQSLIISKKLEEYNVKRYKYSYLPTASLTGAYQKNAYANDYNFFGKNGTWFTTSYAGININVPIFSGFAKDANLQKARLQLIQTQNQIDNLKISIDNDVAQSLNKFRSAIITVDFQKKNMALAESVYNQTKKKYESGLASNTDVTNAQTDFLTAQTNYINALYDAVVAKVDYNKAIGKL